MEKIQDIIAIALMVSAIAFFLTGAYWFVSPDEYVSDTPINIENNYVIDMRGAND